MSLDVLSTVLVCCDHAGGDVLSSRPPIVSCCAPPFGLCRCFSVPSHPVFRDPIMSETSFEENRAKCAEHMRTNTVFTPPCLGVAFIFSLSGWWSPVHAPCITLDRANLEFELDAKFLVEQHQKMLHWAKIDASVPAEFADPGVRAVSGKMNVALIRRLGQG